MSLETIVPIELFVAAPPHTFHFGMVEQWLLASGVGPRLLVACVLGSVIGVEREWRKKSLGWRTNLLICCGCAMFTFLSAILAGDTNPDKGRVASNIVQGVGFLGAGLILRNRDRIVGLTNAATVFAVASIGMACGAGLFVPAALATVIVVAALVLIGIAETRFNIKLISRIYEARGPEPDAVLSAVLSAFDRYGLHLVNVERDAIAQVQRITFPLDATRSQHRQLEAGLRSTSAIAELRTFDDLEDG